MARIAIIGSGFSGISAAAYLAKAGHEVHVFEKNTSAGGRARQFKTGSGYVFDMGPSWYWMPGVFEQFFNDFGSNAADFYTLTLLDPAFEIVFPKEDKVKIPASFEQLCHLFESIEAGSAEKLRTFMQEAQYKYEVAMNQLVHMPGLSAGEFLNADLLKGILRLDVFQSLSRHVSKYFCNEKLIALMEFPVLFLGAKPQDIPALYSLMNYAGLKLGTWYPQDGFGKVVESMVKVAQGAGATFHFSANVSGINTEDKKVKSIVVNDNLFACDAVVAAADYHHVETLLKQEHKNYTASYWSGKTFAPSCLIFYIGVKRQVKNLLHHTLFFENSLAVHADEIYTDPQWPSQPLFYVCCPSKTDHRVAPAGHENIFLLMPIAPGLEDTPELRETYFTEMMLRLEKHTGEAISADIDYKKSYCVNDFIVDYNAYKGNAYGLANTLAQTALLKPKIRNKHLSNLVYAGQLTVPGPGVPPSIISGKIAANQLINQFKKQPA